MTDPKFAELAAAECAAASTGTHCGAPGKPYWNPESYQFMFCPKFQFQPIPGHKSYRYTLKDERGNLYMFNTKSTSASLTPVWKDIPEGVVTLTVCALDAEGNETYPVGARTFFRLSPFPADLPDRARSYRDASRMAYEYALSQPFIRHWITDGTPDPDYNHNVYPSKMICAIIRAMINYAHLCPERAEEAMTVARNSADYLIGISPKDGPMKGIPPTYQIDFRPDPETRNNLKAATRLGTVMMIYPPDVADAYLCLEAETGDRRYLDAALVIGEFFRNTVEENGSWYLIRSISTGEVLAKDFCDPLRVIVPFMMKLYRRTGDASYKTLADNAIAFVEKTSLETYSWGAQFEDSECSRNYSNLTHYGANALARHYCRYYADDEAKMALAEELLHFTEDQFVVWKRPAPWNRTGHDPALWPTPCAMEQYNWHVPIDASTGDFIKTFLSLYQAGRGELYLEKAKALADSITRVQSENGMIPTHWMNEKFRGGAGLWTNCLFASADALRSLSEAIGE